MGIPIDLKVLVTLSNYKIQKNFMQYFPRKTALVCGLGNMMYFNWKYIDFQESGFAVCY